MTAPGEVASQVTDPTDVVGRRCAQFLIDRLLVLVPVVALGVIACFTLAPTSLHGLLTFAEVLVGVLFLLTVLGFLAVDVWWPHRHAGQTPAMRWLGLRIIREDGGQAPLAALALRWLLMVVDGFLWGLVGLLVMVCNVRHRRVGDLVAATLVIRAD
jgi:uncharacterized RDD family membrane protein YckC